jgi:hypothetical protein
METVTLRAHYDGKQILLDEPFQLEPNTVTCHRQTQIFK